MKSPWPADRVERRTVAALMPYARNARTHSPEQVDQIAASIREWGWTVPVLVDEHDGLIAGHARVLAARKLLLVEIPVMVARGWSEAQKRAYVLADNKLAMNSGWDNDLLKIELGDLQTMDFDLALTGFAPDEIAGLNFDVTAGLTDPDDAPERPAAPVSEPGDVWVLGRHRLICGDATNADDVERALAGVQPHLMVTDPPYGVEYDPAWRARAGVNRNTAKLGKVENDDTADWTGAWRLFPGDVVYIWHAGKFAAVVQTSLENCGFDIRAQIIWAKDRFALSRGDYHWQHEPCWYAVRKSQQRHWSGDRSQSTLWTIKSRESGGLGHGTQKPVECMRRPIENNSSPGQAIYEPFCGSGTTIVAGEMTGRCVYALELNPAYVDVAVSRW
ncbi:MAG: site-specific DNA-methyltransferase, partial [Methylobacteriaceae bacterium]|nr:site-specific DNA-methyltransferase [Methylobacteriaceae bacterium]